MLKFIIPDDRDPELEPEPKTQPVEPDEGIPFDW